MRRLAIFGMLLGAVLAVGGGCSETKPKKYLLDAEGLPLDPIEREKALAERARMENEAAAQAAQAKKDFEAATANTFKHEQEALKSVSETNKAEVKEMERKAEEIQAQVIAQEKAKADAARKKEADDKVLLDKQAADEAKAEEARIAAEAKALSEGKDGKPPATSEPKKP